MIAIIFAGGDGIEIVAIINPVDAKAIFESHR